LQAASFAIVEWRAEPALDAAKEAFLKTFHVIAFGENLEMIRPAAGTAGAQGQELFDKCPTLPVAGTTIVAFVKSAVERLLPPTAMFTM
jgi:hypothetical protein